MDKLPSDAEVAVADFKRFRKEVRQARLDISEDSIVQLMIAAQLKVIAGHLDSLQFSTYRLSEPS